MIWGCGCKLCPFQYLYICFPVPENYLLKTRSFTSVPKKGLLRPS